MAAPALGIMGQAAPAAATPADLYGPVTAGRRFVGSTLVCCETGGNASKLRIWARKTGVAAGVGNAEAYDLALDANGRYSFTEGLTLAAGERITVQSDTGTVTFTLHGQEEDVPAA